MIMFKITIQTKAEKNRALHPSALLFFSSDLGGRGRGELMESTFGDWPSFDPHNFSHFRPSDPSNPSKMTPTTYHPTHSRTMPPPDQVISTEAKNILIRNFYRRNEEKLRPKRAASELLNPDHGGKQPRASTSFAESTN